MSSFLLSEMGRIVTPDETSLNDGTIVKKAVIDADVPLRKQDAGEAKRSAKRQNRTGKRFINSAEVLKRLKFLNADGNSAGRGEASLPNVIPVARADEQRRMAQQDLRNDRILGPATSGSSITVPGFLSSNVPDDTQDPLGLVDVEIDISKEVELPVPILGDEIVVPINFEELCAIEVAYKDSDYLRTTVI